jgi:hypothetical protein
MSAEVLLGTYGHIIPTSCTAANAVTSKHLAAAVESVVGLEDAREKGKRPDDVLVGVAGFEPATPASRTSIAIEKINKNNDFCPRLATFIDVY